MHENDQDVDLSQFDEEYATAPEAEKKEFAPVPNGKYQVKVDKAYLGKAKSTGAAMLKWELVIISGQYQGQRLFRNNMLATKENFSWLKTDLATAGMHLEKMSDLKPRLGELLDVALEVSVRNRKEDGQDRQNVYLNKKLDIKLPEKFQKSNENPVRSGGDLPF